MVITNYDNLWYLNVIIFKGCMDQKTKLYERGYNIIYAVSVMFIYFSQYSDILIFQSIILEINGVTNNI